VGGQVTKVILSDAVAQVDGLSGRRYGGNTSGRVFDMSPADAKAVVKLGGAMASLSGTTRRRIGWRCPNCQFGSFLKRCSRCGGECTRE
jgi:hypothetical protein